MSRMDGGNITVMESQTLPDVYGKLLEFIIDIQDAQFNHECWYMLQLTLMNSHIEDFSEVRMSKGDGGVFSVQHSVKTDFTKQEENAPLSFFKEKKFTFRLPRGFCKNDKNYEVYLLVEAFSTSDSTSGRTRKVGEGKFAIYPRPNAPRMNLFAEPGEDYYRYTDIMSLLRTSSADNIQMHCGRIRSTYSLREVVPPKPKSPPKPKTPAQKHVKHDLTPLPTPRILTTPTESSYQPGSQRDQHHHIPPPPSTAQSGSSWGENFSINLPPSPPLPPLSDDRKMPETPQKHGDYESFHANKSYRHVAGNGKEQIDVIMHGATGLPTVPNGGAPLPYAVIKTQRDDEVGTKSGGTTHASVRPTHIPSWEEMVSIDLDDNSANDETLVISVADSETQKSLVKYKVPVTYLTPFHQYHIEMNVPARGNPSGVRTFASITRKLSHLPKDPSCPNYLALEVLLRSVQKPIRSPVGPLIAVSRIVPDYYNYRSDNLQSQPRNAGVMMHNVTFPSAHPSNFIVSNQTHQGHPQLSLPGRPDHRPEWNHPYMFVEDRDKATLFTPTAALVIEYYIASETMSDKFWKMQAPVAFSAVLMDVDMYKHLTAPRANNGLRLEGVPMQGDNMVGEDGKRLTVGMILRLITDETPEALVATSNYDDIPQLDMFPPSEFPGYYQAESPDILKVENGEPSADGENADSTLPSRSIPRTPMREPRNSIPKSEARSAARSEGRSAARSEGRSEARSPPRSEAPMTNVESQEKNKPGYYLKRVCKRPLSPVQDGEMPSYTAMEAVLPEYQYIFQGGPDGKQSPTARAGPAPATYDDDSMMDKGSMGLIDHQSKELSNYRGAVKKMGGDILAGRSQIQKLENINSNLRRDLANYNDASRLMVDSADLDGLTKPEILSRYAAIKQTLGTQTADLKTYKTRLQTVQNELIKKNDEEKHYLKVQKAHATQQQEIQKLQDKLAKGRKLEGACKQQESVIQKMERVIERHHKDRSKSNKDDNKDKVAQANEALLEENKRLRDRVSEMQSQLHVAGGASSREDMERMELLQVLERSEARITSLEQQLAMNARQWGKERAELSLRQNEAEHGFGRTARMVYHNDPIYNEKFNTGKSGLKRLSPVIR